MAKRRWFLMDRETFEVARPACEELQAQQNPRQALQTLWNSEMSACLIRLDGASKEWRASQSWTSRCTEVYCRSSHPGPEVMENLAPIPADHAVGVERSSGLLAALAES